MACALVRKADRARLRDGGAVLSFSKPLAIGAKNLASMDYDEAAAERLEAVYLGPDVVAQRAETLRLLGVQPGEAVLDIGSGPGFLATDLAEAVGPEGRVIGIDNSEPMVARAKSRANHDWLCYETADATSLPFEDASFDVVVSTQVAEYIADIEGFCAEFTRVLRPGGRGLIVATDWDAVCFHSEDPDRMARVMAAFAPHCADSRLPRTLGPRLRNSGLVVDEVCYFPIINPTCYKGCYSAGMMPFIRSYIQGQGTLPEAELDAWMAEQADLDARGEYFFSTGRFMFMVSRPG